MLLSCPCEFLFILWSPAKCLHWCEVFTIPLPHAGLYSQCSSYSSTVDDSYFSLTGITWLYCLFVCSMMLLYWTPQSLNIIPPVAFCSISSGSSLLWLWCMHWTLQLFGLGAEIEMWVVAQGCMWMMPDFPVAGYQPCSAGLWNGQWQTHTTESSFLKCVHIGWYFSFVGLPS